MIILKNNIVMWDKEYLDIDEVNIQSIKTIINNKKYQILNVHIRSLKYKKGLTQLQLRI